MFSNSRSVLRILKINLFVQGAIIVTGAIVRITKSGLGCPTWPQCVGDSIVPLATQSESWHKYVEFGNRLLTFVLLIVAALVVIAVWRNSRNAKLRALAFTPILGTVFQAILGGITVLTGLHPTTVAAHFLVSIVIVALSQSLLRNFADEGKSKVYETTPNILVAGAFISIVLGTLVTGSGPHSGDKNASSRFEFDMATISNVHAKSIWIYCALFGYLAFRRYKISSNKAKKSFELLAAIVIGQGFLGYYQYFNGVPEVLVFLHIIGSVIFWIANLRLRSDLAQNQSV
ncbi:MAG: hypothetical protein RL228_196 [Actinomycetota bacterium]